VSIIQDVNMRSNVLYAYVIKNNNVDYERPILLWQRATPVIMGWLAGQHAKIMTGVLNRLKY